MPERAADGTLPAQPEAPPRSGLATDYAALESALSAFPRGRWFLAEYARRNRTAETDMLLEAIAKLETAVLKPQRQAPPGNVFADLVEMSEAIARTRREIAQIRPPQHFDKQLLSATEELDHIVEATEKATSDILQAAEEIQEVAWTLRERGTEIELCDRIDQRATDIYTACSFQDITGQRTGKVVRALRFIEQRINAMIEIWGVDDVAFRLAALEQSPQDDQVLLNGPQRMGGGLKQDDVDRMLVGGAPKPQGEAGAGAAAPKTLAPMTPEATAPKGEAGSFQPPEPLTLARLHAVKRAALFG